MNRTNRPVERRHLHTPATGHHAARQQRHDGDPESRLHHACDLLSVLLNDGRGGFAPAPGAPYRLGARAFSVVASDVNRDGRTDIVAATGNSVTVLLGGEQGPAPAPGSPFRAGPGAWYMALGDFDENGVLDIATSDFEAGTVTILLGTTRT